MEEKIMAIILKANQREDRSRAATKQIRRDGMIPAVVYGKEKDTQTVSVPNMELLKTMRDEGRHAIISLEIENANTVDVMVHEYQTDPVRGDVTHIDFYIVDMSEEMDVAVPLHLEGEAQGTKDGGVLQQPLFELQVRAKPRDIPEEITVNIDHLEIGDSIAVQDIKVSGQFELIDDPETTVATISAPEAEEEETTASSDSVEPELVGAGEEEEA